jgi:ribonuclease J
VHYDLGILFYGCGCATYQHLNLLQERCFGTFVPFIFTAKTHKEFDLTMNLKVIPIGGHGEIGKNMSLFQYGSDAILIDAGLMFPENDMLGIDYIIPDYRHIANLNLRIHGIVITHGHEDHIGAIIHAAAAFASTPIYATPLTMGLIEVKLKQARLLDQTKLSTFRAGDVLKLGPFEVETFHVCHSIPDCVGLGINTPVGLFVHSGDFKIDHTPVDGKPTDFAKLAEFSKRGVVALFSDSTNAEKPGWTPSEAVIDNAFDRVFADAPGRIIVATFASLISRIQQVAWAANRYQRRLAIGGHTMLDNARMAMRLGYLNIPQEMMMALDDVRSQPANKTVIMVTGAQGEPSAVLSRLANGKYNVFNVEPDDTIVLSSHPIPGNEESVSRTINRLIQRGANVVYDPIEQVHVSGHASQEEQKLLLNMVRPKNFVPVHGELRQLTQHSRLAQELGIPYENIAVVENGSTINFDAKGKMSIGERIPGGYVFVDGSRVGDVGPTVMKEREILARDGIVVVSALYDRARKQFINEPHLTTKGFVHEPQAKDILDGARQLVRKIVVQNSNGRLNEELYDALGKYFNTETRSRPQVFVSVNEI